MRHPAQGATGGGWCWVLYSSGVCQWSEVKWICSVVSDSCNPMDSSRPGSSIHGILHARILEWVAMSFCRGTSLPRDRTRVSRIAGRCFTLWATEGAVSVRRGVKTQVIRTFGGQKALCPLVCRRCSWELRRVKTEAWCGGTRAKHELKHFSCVLKKDPENSAIQ